MNARGFCTQCHKEKVVAVTDYATGKLGPVPIGRCFDCRNAANDRRREAGELFIFVPADDAAGLRGLIRPGSAIVGRPVEDGWFELYYEGDIYGSMKGFDEMLLHAADRLVTHYPTVARTRTKADNVVQVGFYDYGAFEAEITEPDLLATWRAA